MNLHLGVIPSKRANLDSSPKMREQTIGTRIRQRKDSSDLPRLASGGGPGKLLQGTRPSPEGTGGWSDDRDGSGRVISVTTY